MIIVVVKVAQKSKFERDKKKRNKSITKFNEETTTINRLNFVLRMKKK